MGKHFFSSKNDLDEKNNQSSVNEKNSLEYQNLMDHSKKTYDDYWDINNPVIRIILIILFKELSILSSGISLDTRIVSAGCKVSTYSFRND